MWKSIGRDWDFLVLTCVLALYVMLGAVAAICLVIAASSVTLP
jgi:hypothetical protein